MSVTAFIRRCLDAGMPVDIALTAAEAFEAEVTVYAPPVRSRGAERSARYRGRKRDESVTKRDDVTPSVTERDEITPLPLSPTSPEPPSSTNPNQVPPYSPPRQKSDEPDLKAVSEEIWQLQPVVGGKRRSTRPDVLKALRAAVERRGQDPARIVTACRTYYRLPDCRKDGGQFASGAAVILAEDRWRDFEPTARERPPPKPEPAIYAAHVRHYRDTGEWKPSWGDKPDLESAA
jgi:hypothetical protein